MRLPFQRRPLTRRAAPRLEELERRLAPATLVVNNVNDIGPGSLRQAILSSDATGPGPNVIDFAIPGAGPQTIRPASALPSLTVPAVVAGTSQPGYVQANAPQVVLDGSGANGNGLTLAANGCTVLGLAIDNFKSGDGVLVQSSGNLIAGNYLGTDATGTRAAGNDIDGVDVFGSAANNVIQNNLISGNAASGIGLDAGTSGTVVSANLIGTDVSATRALGNGGGIFVSDSPGNRIGGNVISGNKDQGVDILGGNTAASNNLVANNLIGTDGSGTQALPNGTGVQVTGAPASTIQSNVISGNSFGGFLLLGGNIPNDRVLILSNLVGVDLSGERPLGNGRAGIEVFNSTNGVVAGNTVAANATGGIVLNGNRPVTGNVVVGNRVGTDAGGTVALGNGGRAGVEVFRGAKFNLIDANLISGNLQDGVAVHDSGTTGNMVQRNLIGLTTAGAPLPNGLHGVEVANGAADTRLFGNDALFNRGHGILIRDAGTTMTDVVGNDSSFNAGAGVLIAAGAANNFIRDGNTLAFNGQAGAWADGPACTQEAISNNAIFGNAGLGGIALTNGANGGPPAPALLYAVSPGPGATAVAGTLHGKANTAYGLEFFDSPSGGGQGQTLVGFLTVTTDGGGSVTFSDDFAGALTSLTATADAFGNTSAFSAPIAVARL
jgi:titin